MTSRLFLIEDHPVVATGMELALRAEGYTVRGASGSTSDAVLAEVRSFAPDCVLLDLRLTKEIGHGADLIPDLLAAGAQVLVVTGETDELTLGECVEAGAAGWVGKGAFLDELIAAVEDVLAGRPLLSPVARASLLERVRERRADLETNRSPFQRLTDREGAVLRSMVEGMTAQEIADADFVSVSTVRSQIRGVLQKLGVRSQLAAVVLANRAGWEPEETADHATDFINSGVAADAVR